MKIFSETRMSRLRFEKFEEAHLFFRALILKDVQRPTELHLGSARRQAAHNARRPTCSRKRTVCVREGASTKIR
jgi:hypothetical protein